MTTTATHQTNDRVRLTVPDVYPDHDGLRRRLGVTLVFRVVRIDAEQVTVTHEITGRRYVLPANKLTRAG